MYAKVIVDVPVIQVNRPFDYHVPEILQESIEVGMRVAVPFGGRSISGFVLALSDEVDFDGEIKDILHLMDLDPVLSPEMIQLGAYLSKKVHAFLIQCYQTMLPAMLKSNYEKRFVLVNPKDHEDVFREVFHYENTLLYTDDLPQEQLKRLMKLKKEGIVVIETVVKDRAKVKTEDWIRLNYVMQEYEEFIPTLSARAKKKISLLKTLASMERMEIQKKSFLEDTDFTTTDLKFAVEHNWITIVQKEVSRDPYKGRFFKKSLPFQLNEGQQLAFDRVKEESIDPHNSKVYLLEGVTGSGKTEVYLQWISEVIAKGQSAMMLVPEIALTPQMVERFKSRFGDRVAVLHSGLSTGEKFDEWRKIKNKEADIVVGARSSIFAPLENIGIIILDEEHETSYKQDESPRYHARDIAIWRGEFHHCPVVLGSATPSLESRARAQKGVYTLLKLTKRAKEQILPEVHLIDMRNEFIHQKGSFSQTLLKAIENRLEKKEQTVLLLNRRGYSSFVLCRDCGYVLECPNCDISLTLHMDTKTMKCHYCGHEERIPTFCPKCQSRQIRYFGTGTQKVQEELQEVFPDARIVRMDVDTTRRKGQHEAILKQFENQEADILIGTQMIAKGLDYPNVTLVGVINADTALNIPDFRSSEKTFQLLTQVSGRAGRGEKTGEVFIQTYNPTHYAIQLAQGHHYERFFETEMRMRHMANYPPYFFTTMITFSSEEEGVALKKAIEVHKSLMANVSPKAVVLGPTAKSIARMNNRYYFQIIVKYKNEPQLQEFLEQLMMETQEIGSKKILMTIDMEPQHFL
mgnify:FL=1